MSTQYDILQESEDVAFPVIPHAESGIELIEKLMWFSSFDEFLIHSCFA